jgi:hypothetical protein
MTQRPPPRSVLVGVMRIARGRADGIACFGASPQAFLSSLAPLLAFPLVGAVLAIFSEGPRRALTGLAVTLCALLTPAVLSFELARLWGRQDAWLLPLSLAIAAGLDETAATFVLAGSLAGYGLWLHWFLASRALGLSTLRAITLVILVNLGTVAAVIGPRLLAKLL